MAPNNPSSPDRNSHTLADVANVHEQQAESTLFTDKNLPWYIIDPTGEIIAEQRRRNRSSQKPSPWPTLYPTWDLVTGIALIFTAIVTPFEVGFLPPPERADEPLFVINRIIDVLFAIDMILQFFVMIPKDTTTVAVDNEWEMGLRPML